MLQIQLGPSLGVDPNRDPLGRSRVGAYPGISEEDAWEAGRGTWKFNPDRALEQDEAKIVDVHGTVLAIGRITGVEKHGDRYALTANLLRGDPRVGQPTSTPHRSRNSVGYF